MKETFGASTYNHFLHETNHMLLNHLSVDDSLLLSLKVKPEFCNIHRTLHGGMMSTIIDNATTLAILKKDLRATVSVNLSVNFLKPAINGDSLYILSSIDRVLS